MEGKPQNATDLGRQLPGAVAESSRRSKRLAASLRPAVEDALTISARTNPSGLARALVPVMGRAIRMACRDKVRRGILRLNHFVLVHMSLRSVRWRAEALRTGQPYADVVRRRTRVRRVRQVFLIHRASGLLVSTAHQGESAALDGDMASAMLTAIQDFVSDSFGTPSRDGLESIQVGGRTVWIEQGRDAVLAGIIDGDAAPELQDIFHDTLKTIHAEFGAALKRFDGDVDTVAGAQVYLDACVRSRLLASGERVLPLTWLLLAAPLILAVVWSGLRLQDYLTWRVYVRQIGAQPGIVVVRSGMRDGRFYIRGLRDPMALNPVEMLAAVGFSETNVISEWESYQALTPAIALIRAKQILLPPETVDLEIDGTVLRAYGTAAGTWMREAQRVARVLPGVTGLDLSGVVDEERQSKTSWDGCVNRLKDEPGIVVLEAGVRDGRPFISGMRDPDALDVDLVIHEGGINPRDVTGHWEPFQSAAPVVALTRARRLLAPPVGVGLALRGSTLLMQGEAPHRWINQAVSTGRALAGIARLDTSGLVDLDMREIARLKEGLEAKPFRVIDQGSDLWPGQSKALSEATSRLQELDQMKRATGIDAVVEIIGHAKNAQDDEANLLVSKNVVQRFRELLERQDVACRGILVRSIGRALPDGASEPVPKRCVFIRVTGLPGDALSQPPGR